MTRKHDRSGARRGRRPNVLILCVDQWQAHMAVPPEVPLPAVRRLEAEGVAFERHYCTVPICTPSRGAMWTGVHAKRVGLWDNTNFAWIDGFSGAFPTVGHLLREQGYYTAFKGKWHLSDVPRSEDALEPYGFADYQPWGEMYGAPLQGEQLDCAAATEVVDWLESRAPALDQPWLLVASFINPHDVMFLQTDPVEAPHERGATAGLRTRIQGMGWFQKQWNVGLPDNFEDDFALQPPAVKHYQELIALNYGQVPDDRVDLWIARRNYLVNAMRMADAEMMRVLEALDRMGLADDTIVVFTGDHGEMNGAHRMTQKGAIHFDEATQVNLVVRAPGGPRGQRTRAVASHLDLTPTLLEWAGLREGEIRERYPHLRGHSLAGVVRDPSSPGPRGDVDRPGRGALLMWDGLHMLDKDWGISGALRELTEWDTAPRQGGEDPRARMRRVGERYGAPNFAKRTFFRAVVDGRYKLVRWFSPLEYGNPATLEDLYARGDVTLHDLARDPGELANLGHPDHPNHDPELVRRMLAKLHAVVADELGEDAAPFPLDLFGPAPNAERPKGPRAGRRNRRGGDGGGGLPV